MSPDHAPTGRMLASSIVEQFAAVIGGRLGRPTTVEADAPPVAPAWTVTIHVGGATPSAVTLGMSRGDLQTLVRLAGGNGKDTSDGAVVEFLQEVVGQAIAGVRPGGEDDEPQTSVDTPCAVTAAPDGSATAFTVRVSPEFAPTLIVWTAAERLRPERADTPFHDPPPLAFVDEPPVMAPPLPANLDVILDIDLPLSVRFGQTELTLDTLTRLGPGSLISLGRSPDGAVDVLVNGRLVARGEVVVVAGNYGVRVLEVVSTADRVRSLRAS